MTDDTANYLHGRILALELLVRGLMDDAFKTRGAKAEHIEQSFALMTQSMQYAHRDVGENEDATWAYAVEALEAMKQALILRRNADG